LCSEERSPVEIVKEVQVQRTDDQKEEEQPALGKNEQNFSNYVKKNYAKGVWAILKTILIQQRCNNYVC